MNISLAESVQYLKEFPKYEEIRETFGHLRNWIVLSGDFSKLAKIEQLTYALTPWNCGAMEEKANKIKISAGVSENELVMLDEKEDVFYIECLESACKEKNPIAIDLYAKHLLSQEIKRKDGDYASLYLTRGKGGKRSEFGIFRCPFSEKFGEFLFEYKKYLSPQFFLLYAINLGLTKLSITFSKKYEDSTEDRDARTFLVQEMKQGLEKYGKSLDKLQIDKIDKEIIQLIFTIFNAYNTKIARAEAVAKLIDYVNESALAKFCIGCCFGVGEIIKKDERKAKAWIQEAAASKLYLACVVLSSLTAGK